jgi:thiamine pyrophosphate-dependent acetolactate synthase large subunit-like protein
MMNAREALEVLARHRAGRVVVTTMSAVGIWPALSDGPLDFAYLPSSMGQGPALGLGLALARPDLGVVVVNGDGSTLMNLGCLVTLASQAAEVYLIILDNSLYEVTGGQVTAGSGRVDFAALARGAGVKRAYFFETGQAWQAGAAEALAPPGPVVIHLQIEGRLGQATPRPPWPMAQQLERLRRGLLPAER